MPTTSNFGWTTPADTDLVKDGAAAIRTLGNGIDSSFLDLKGGTTGQVLSKASNTDLDFSWVAQDDSNAIQNAIVDAKGDLISATAADTPARLAVGANGTVLTADSAEATGLKWAAPAGGGKVLQVVYGSTTTAASSSSSTYADTNLTATITPTSATSTILIMVAQQVTKSAASASNELKIRIMRGATSIQEFISAQGITTATALAIVNFTVASYYRDSPATTSATTYKTQFASVNSTATLTCQNGGDSTSSIILMEIGA